MTKDRVPVHGASEYCNHRCRCEVCTEAHRVAQARQNARRKESDTPDDIHGRYTTYSNWGCRCDLCTAATKEYVQGRRAARRAGE